ncbi:MAG: DUF433 domain-containing protein [Planctomycetes bacterium]|nr:DUF433 domain-containing protein [Planctomycetota bacterium]
MAVTTSWISKKPERCGGDACVRDTRIPVWIVINAMRLGASEADVLRSYPSLTASDLEAARDYASTHQEEIDRAIVENEAGDGGLAE